jgi:hypothetical protein
MSGFRLDAPASIYMNICSTWRWLRRVDERELRLDAPATPMTEPVCARERER